MAKILFLGIDGVLNPTDNDYAMHMLWKIKKGRSRDEFGTLFDERCERWLKWIVLQTGCKIVISSTWRMSGLGVMQLMWKKRKLAGEVIDCTAFDVSEEIIKKYAAKNNEADRGYEIQEWIDVNKPYNYCILDDQNDMLSHQNFVQTNPEFGLNRKTAMAVIAVLNSFIAP